MSDFCSVLNVIVRERRNKCLSRCWGVILQQCLKIQNVQDFLDLEFSLSMENCETQYDHNDLKFVM